MRVKGPLTWLMVMASVAASIGAAAATERDSRKPLAPPSLSAFQQAAARPANPVKASPESIAAGQKVFEKNCVPCHGPAGKGDGKMAAQLNPPPPDLTDGEWKHGPQDGDLFTVIRDGAKGTGMKGFAGRMTSQDIWNVVNYLRTLGPPPAKPQ